MRTEEIISEVKFNMSTIGLNEKAARRVSEAKALAVHRIQAYELYAALGSVEDFERLRLKSIPDEPIKIVTEEKILYRCPCCAAILVEQYDTVKRGHIAKFCENCGKALSNEGGI